MRWFFIILFFAVAVAAGTAPLWWKPLMPLLGHPPRNLDKLSTYITAVAALLGVVATFAGQFFKEKESPKEETKPTAQGSIVKGNVVVKGGDFVGLTITTRINSHGRPANQHPGLSSRRVATLPGLSDGGIVAR